MLRKGEEGFSSLKDKLVNIINYNYLYWNNRLLILITISDFIILEYGIFIYLFDVIILLFFKII